MRFEGTDTYIATEDLMVAVNAALALERPLLVKGEPGTGKTVLAHEVATRARQAAHPVAHQVHDQGPAGALRVRRRRAPARLPARRRAGARHQQLHRARQALGGLRIERQDGAVLLIDEIDKADIEFPNDLLLELDRMEFFVYETKETVAATPVGRRSSSRRTTRRSCPTRSCAAASSTTSASPTPDDDGVASSRSTSRDLRERELLHAAMPCGLLRPARRPRASRRRPPRRSCSTGSSVLEAEDISRRSPSQKDREGLGCRRCSARCSRTSRTSHARRHVGNRLASAGGSSTRARQNAVFIRFFYELRKARVPVTLREFLTLLEALDKGVHGYSQRRELLLPLALRAGEGRALLRSLRSGLRTGTSRASTSRPRGRSTPTSPRSGCASIAERLLHAGGDGGRSRALGGWDELHGRAAQAAAPSRNERHQGGSKWIGTAGTSPFGAYGYNPEGIRIGPGPLAPPPGREGLGPARVPRLRRLGRARHAQHQGRAAAPAQASCARARATRNSTCRDHPRHGRTTGGYLRRLRARARTNKREGAPAPRRRRVDGRPHPPGRAALLGMPAAEFKHLEHYYFHNCVYEFGCGATTARRWDDTPTFDVLAHVRHGTTA